MPILHLVPPAGHTSSDSQPVRRPATPASLYTCQSIHLSRSPSTKTLMSRLGLSRLEAAGVRLLLDEECAITPGHQGGCLGECSGRVLAGIVELPHLDGDQLLEACIDAGLVHHDDQGRLHNTDFCRRYRIQKAKDQAARDATCRKSARQRQRRAEAKAAQEDRMEAPRPAAMVAAGGGVTHASLASPRLQHGVSEASRTASMAQKGTYDAPQGTSELTPLSSLLSPLSSSLGQRSGAGVPVRASAGGGDSPIRAVSPPPHTTITCESGSRRDDLPSAEIAGACEARPAASPVAAKPARLAGMGWQTPPPPPDDGYLDSLMADTSPTDHRRPAAPRPARRQLAPWQRPLDRQRPGEGVPSAGMSPRTPAASPPAASRPVTPPTPPTEQPPTPPLPVRQYGLPIDLERLADYTRSGAIAQVIGRYVTGGFKPADQPSAEAAIHAWEQLGEDGQLAKVQRNLTFLLRQRGQDRHGAEQPEATLAHAVEYRPLVDGYVRSITDAHMTGEGQGD